MFSHPQYEEILKTVLELRQEGRTIAAIAHEIGRRFSPPGKPKRVNRNGWHSSHVVAAIEELRRRGDMPGKHIFVSVPEMRRTALAENLKRKNEQRRLRLKAKRELQKKEQAAEESPVAIRVEWNSSVPGPLCQTQEGLSSSLSGSKMISCCLLSNFLIFIKIPVGLLMINRHLIS